MAELNNLIAACKKNKPSAQKSLYNQLADQLYWTCKRYLKHEEDVEEALADSFYIIFTKIKQLKNPEAIYTWSKRITINHCLKRIKKEFTHLYIEDMKTHPATDEVAEAKLGELQLLELVDQLPEGCQTIFKLFVIEGYTHKDIAQLLEISAGTSKSQLNVAKTKLKTLVNLYYYQNEKENEQAG
jgi:RNA polymerase sigma-70 factor (ECF subfamily)